MRRNYYIAAVLLVGGCVNGINSEQHQELDAKVNQLRQEVEALRQDIGAAKDEAERANYRLDSDPRNMKICL